MAARSEGHLVSSTPLWVPLVVAGIGVAGTLVAGIAGTLIAQRWANQRDDKTWAREREREQERWRREDEARTFEHRREAFEECYQAIKALANERMTTATASTARQSCPSTGTRMRSQSSTSRELCRSDLVQSCGPCVHRRMFMGHAHEVRRPGRPRVLCTPAEVRRRRVRHAGAHAPGAIGARGRPRSAATRLSL